MWASFPDSDAYTYIDRYGHTHEYVNGNTVPHTL
jgi:hypothetical protein